MIGRMENLLILLLIFVSSSSRIVCLQESEPSAITKSENVSFPAGYAEVFQNESLIITEVASNSTDIMILKGMISETTESEGRKIELIIFNLRYAFF